MHDNRHGSTSPQEVLKEYHNLSQQADHLMWDVAGRDPRDLSERFDRFNEGLKRFRPGVEYPLIIPELITVKAHILHALIVLRRSQESPSSPPEDVLRDLQFAAYTTVTNPVALKALEVWVSEQLPKNYPSRQEFLDHFENALTHEQLWRESPLSLMQEPESPFSQASEALYRATTSLRSLEHVLVQRGFADLNHLEEQFKIANNAVMDLRNLSTDGILTGPKPGLLSAQINHIAALIEERKPDSNPEYVAFIKTYGQDVATSFDCLPEYEEWMTDLHRKLSLMS